MILIVLGTIFDRVGFSIAVRQALAWSLLLGSIAFPFGVILQATHHGGRVSSAIAIVGSGLVIAGMSGTALGLARYRSAS